MIHANTHEEYLSYTPVSNEKELSPSLQPMQNLFEGGHLKLFVDCAAWWGFNQHTAQLGHAWALYPYKSKDCVKPGPLPP